LGVLRDHLPFGEVPIKMFLEKRAQGEDGGTRRTSRHNKLQGDHEGDDLPDGDLNESDLDEYALEEGELGDSDVLLDEEEQA